MQCLSSALQQQGKQHAANRGRAHIEMLSNECIVYRGPDLVLAIRAISASKNASIGCTAIASTQLATFHVAGFELLIMPKIVVI
jgi:hypothetical protein